MKTLYILRHAKSDRSDKSVDDFDRWLSERGKADLKDFPEHVANSMEEIDHIVASPAKRTAQTADLWANALWYDEGDIEYTRALYMANTDEIKWDRLFWLSWRKMVWLRLRTSRIQVVWIS